MWILLGWLVCAWTCQAGFDENTLRHWGHWVKEHVVETYPLRGKLVDKSALTRNLTAAEPFLHGLRSLNGYLRNTPQSLEPEQLGILMRSTISHQHPFLLSDLLEAETGLASDQQTAERIAFLSQTAEIFQSAYAEHPGLTQDIILITLWEQHEGTLALRQYMRGLGSLLTDEGVEMLRGKEVSFSSVPSRDHARIASFIPENILLAADLIPLQTFLKSKPLDAFHLLLELGAKDPRVKHPKLLRAEGFYVAPEPQATPVFVSDTLETAMRNAFLVALFKAEEEEIDVAILELLPAVSEVETHSSIRDFFKKFPTLKDQSTLRARTQWARALGSFPDLRYQVVLHQEKLGLEPSIQNFETLLAHIAIPTLTLSPVPCMDLSLTSRAQSLFHALTDGALIWHLANTSSKDQPRLQLSFTQRGRLFQSLEFQGLQAILQIESLPSTNTLNQLAASLIKEPHTKATLLGLELKKHQSILQEDSLIFLQKWMQADSSLEEFSYPLLSSSSLATKCRTLHPDWLKLFFQKWKQHMYAENPEPLEILALLRKTVPILKATKGLTPLSQELFSDWMEMAEITPEIAASVILDLLDASLDVPLFNWIQSDAHWFDKHEVLSALLRSKRSSVVLTLFQRSPLELLKSIRDSAGNTIAHLFMEEVPYSFIKQVLERTSEDPSFWSTENNEGDTPLHLAIQRDHPAWAKALVRTLPVSARFKENKKGQNPLHLAVALGKKIPTALLLEGIEPKDALRRQKDDKHIFHLAAERPGDEAFLDFLTDFGPIPREEVERLLLKRDRGRLSPFQLSLRSGGDQAKILVNGLPLKPLKEKNLLQNTPPHEVAEHGRDPSVLKVFEQQFGQDIYKETNIFGDTVLHLLARHQEDYLAERVYKEGLWIQMERSILEKRNKLGLSVFDHCLHINSHPQLSSTLLPILSNEHLLESDAFGFTSLHRIVLARPDLLTSICLRFIEEDLKPKSSLLGWTPLQLGCVLGRQADQMAPLIEALSTVSLLEESLDGNTCLHLSAAHGDNGAAHALLQRMGGGALGMQNRILGLNPLHIALLFAPHSAFLKSCVQKAPTTAWLQKNILFENPLHLGASYVRDPEVFEGIIERIPEEALYQRNYRLDQPLHSAIRAENQTAIRFFEKRMRPDTLTKPFLWHPSPRSLARKIKPLNVDSRIFDPKKMGS